MRRPRRTRTLYLSLMVGVAVFATTASAASTAETITALGGGVSATLSYRHDGSAAALMPYRDLSLVISSRRRTSYRAPVQAALCGTQCWPAVGVPGIPVLEIATLDPGHGPDVILNLYSGGAHCCSITQVFGYSGGSYSLTQHDFADPGAKLERLKGRWVFVSADARFAYTFTSFAFSGLPLEIWRFGGSRFTDVTRGFPTRIAADAKRQYAAYLANRGQGEGLGFIAAWAADEYLLGRQAKVSHTLARLAAAGELRSGDGFAKSGAAFVTQLDSFLSRAGYA